MTRKPIRAYLPRWFTFPTTPRERWLSNRSQLRRIAWLDAEADTFNSQREARSRAYFIEKDRANG